MSKYLIIIKKYYFVSIFKIVLLFILSLLLLCLLELFNLYWYDLTREFVENLSKIIMGTTATLVAFIAVFYVFRFRVLTENKRQCGYKKRMFKEKINKSKSLKEKLSEIEAEIKQKLDPSFMTTTVLKRIYLSE